jgi:hypothetical protein
MIQSLHHHLADALIEDRLRDARQDARQSGRGIHALFVSGAAALKGRWSGPRSQAALIIASLLRREAGDPPVHHRQS